MKKRKLRNDLEKLGVDLSQDNSMEAIDVIMGQCSTGKEFDEKAEILLRNAETIQLQHALELITGDPERARYLCSNPLIVQCHCCHRDFGLKDDLTFGGSKVINLKTHENIVGHLINCKGVRCDCGRFIHYFKDCTCGMKWQERSIALLSYRKDYPYTKEQKEQIKRYKKTYKNESKR